MQKAISPLLLSWQQLRRNVTLCPRFPALRRPSARRLTGQQVRSIREERVMTEAGQMQSRIDLVSAQGISLIVQYASIDRMTSTNRP